MSTGRYQTTSRPRFSRLALVIAAFAAIAACSGASETEDTLVNGGAGSGAGGSGGASGTSGKTGTSGTGGTGGASGKTGAGGGAGQAGASGKGGGAAGISGAAGGPTAGNAGSGAMSGGAGSGQGGAGSGQGGAGSGQGGAASGGAASGGAGAAGCSPACVAPQTCSVANTCIDPGTCAADGDCPGGKQCDPGSKTCVIGSSCGVTQINSEIVPPNLLMVLDRSCTMNGMLGAQSKWELAVGAINSLVGNYKGKILFGLTLFPDHVDPKCDQAKYLLPPMAGNESTIQALLTAGLDPKDTSHPGNPCVTNGAQTMKQASTEPSLDDKTRKSYFVLVTDGLTQQVCDLTGAPEGTTKIIENLHQMRGIPTYVIGFGSGQIDMAELNNFAVAGGVPANDPNDPSFKYYRAEDGATLEAALKSIAQKSLGCEYKLASTPPDIGNVHVFLDKSSEVAQDAMHKDGWDYDSATNQVNFYGMTCDSLKAGTVNTVDIVLGCPGGGSGGSSGSGGAGGSGGTCASGKPTCDLTKLCPDDPKLGKGFCSMGCCTYGKQ